MAHTVDVDGMLDSMTHDQFDEWCAKDIVEPIGHGGTHDILARIGVMLAAFMGSKNVDETLFKPWEKEASEPVAKSDSIPQMMSLAAVGWKVS